MDSAQTIAHIAGQRIMAGFYGTTLNTDLKFFIDTVGVGGIILFARNIENRQQVKRLCADAQAYAQSCGTAPLMVAVDQEGGPVARLKAPDFTEFAGAAAMTSTADAAAFADITARELSDAGINMNMAPVMDVAPAGFDSVMADRVFGSDPAWVAQMGTTIIQRLQQKQIMAVAKHFPGIGRTTADSHIVRPDLDAPRDLLAAFDLLPFTAAIESEVAAMMLSHIRYTAIDPVWPASLSPAIVGTLLRQSMGYDGAVITDDLEMGALRQHYDMPAIIDQVLFADVDIALICHTRKDIETACAHMIQKINDNAALLEAGSRSLARIAALKERFGLQG
ncbi:MAG: glycoside hydrolase family 3 N-terminal domain-containing protein [Thermodesulfobacteriota bacterium]